MNNKQIGTAFERKVCEMLKEQGYWVHFIAPDSRGSQPFDIIAVKDGIPLAIDCKTLSTSEDTFYAGRMEENQILAFEYWLKCGNPMPMIFVEHGDKIIKIDWATLRDRRKVRIADVWYLDKENNNQLKGE